MFFWLFIESFFWSKKAYKLDLSSFPFVALAFFLVLHQLSECNTEEEERGRKKKKKKRSQNWDFLNINSVPSAPIQKEEPGTSILSWREDKVS